MKDSVLIRDLQWGDFRQVVENFYSYYDELKENPNLGILVGGKKPKITEEVDWFSELYKRILKEDAVASVAEIDGMVVGLCNINRAILKEDAKHRGILGIAIIKGHRGKGVGLKLMASCMKKARGKFEIVTLSTFADNKTAIKLYEKCGFRRYGAGKNFIKRNGRYTDEYFYAFEF
ncbi:MAG TPA: GNAT family N-acetyltransferase [Candidatus Saccharimonadales bacterium]|nr:GNAT family N-acetyltransferase [Candidatus Saccharimonadales bacterium]